MTTSQPSTDDVRLHATEMLPGLDNATSVTMEPDASQATGLWAPAFLILQLSMALMLIAPGIQFARIAVRAGSLGLSILLLIFIQGRAAYTYPSRIFAYLVMGLLALEMFHPDTIPTSGFALVLYYLSVLSLIFWIPRLAITRWHFMFSIVTLWLYNFASALFGYLQVRYPGRFQPEVSANYASREWQTMSITLPDGQRIPRPFGLTDNPGGASAAGLFCVVFGMAFLLFSKNNLVRAISLASVFLGMFCLYVCQVRALMVMSAMVLLIWFVILLIQRDTVNAGLMGLIGVTMSILVFSYASAVGGQDVIKRLSTLTEGSATDVYTQNRGHFLTSTITDEIPNYPLGAGLGRWGTMYAYFAKYSQSNSPSLWAEIQLTGWIYDGGVPLAILYYMLIGTTIWTTWRFATFNAKHPLVYWAGLITAYDLGTLAASFSFHSFVGDSGQQFFLLNVALYGAFFYADRAGEFADPQALVPATIEPAQLSRPSTAANYQ